MKTYSSVNTAISLVIIAALSPNTLPWKKAMGVYARLCQCMCETYYFSLACSSRWQPNYHFQRYTDIQIENCTQERGSFLSGWWFMGCLCRTIFSPIFFSSLCFSTVSSIVSYLHRRCHREEERKWMEEGEKMTRYVTSLKKCRLQASIESGKTAASAKCMYGKGSTNY